MADDLDAFFDEVEEVEAQAEQQQQQQQEEEEEEKPPPRKKAKPTVVGVVVASASEKKKVVTEPASVTATATTTTASETKPSGIAPAATLAATVPGAVSGAATPPVGPLPVAGSHNNNATTTTTTNTTTKPKAHIRTAAGKTWIDPTLEEWPENDFRIFVGNLDPTITDEQVWQHFCRYPSLLKARVIRDNAKPGAPSKGYAFVSLGNALECAKALRELDQTWLGSRPCRLKRCNWKDRELNQVRKNEKKRHKQQKRMGLL